MSSDALTIRHILGTIDWKEWLTECSFTLMYQNRRIEGWIGRRAAVLWQIDQNRLQQMMDRLEQLDQHARRQIGALQPGSTPDQLQLELIQLDPFRNEGEQWIQLQLGYGIQEDSAGRLYWIVRFDTQLTPHSTLYCLNASASGLQQPFVWSTGRPLAMQSSTEILQQALQASSWRDMSEYSLFTFPYNEHSVDGWINLPPEQQSVIDPQQIQQIIQQLSKLDHTARTLLQQYAPEAEPAELELTALHLLPLRDHQTLFQLAYAVGASSELLLLVRFNTKLQPLPNIHVVQRSPYRDEPYRRSEEPYVWTASDRINRIRAGLGATGWHMWSPEQYATVFRLQAPLHELKGMICLPLQQLDQLNLYWLDQVIASFPSLDRAARTLLQQQNPGENADELILRVLELYPKGLASETLRIGYDAGPTEHGHLYLYVHFDEQLQPDPNIVIELY